MFTISLSRKKFFVHAAAVYNSCSVQRNSFFLCFLLSHFWLGDHLHNPKPMFTIVRRVLLSTRTDDRVHTTAIGMRYHCSGSTEFTVMNIFPDQRIRRLHLFFPSLNTVLRQYLTRNQSLYCLRARHSSRPKKGRLLPT